MSALCSSFPTPSVYVARLDITSQFCGQHHVTWHNMGICYFYLEQFEEAVQCFQASLALNPTYEEARNWLARAAERAGLDVGAAVSAAAGSAEQADDLSEEYLSDSQVEIQPGTHAQ